MEDSSTPATDTVLIEPEIVTNDGIDMWVDSQELISSNIRGPGGCWEEHTTDVIKETLSPGDTAIDIGAHIGVHTVTMRAAVGETGHVYAFEPFPQHFDYLSHTVDMNGWENVNVSKAAISDTTGTAILALRQHRLEGKGKVNTGVSHLLSRNKSLPQTKMGGEYHEINTLSVADMFDTIELDSCKLLKMDVEGEEYNILSELLETGLYTCVDTVIIEFHSLHSKKRECEVDIYVDIFRRLCETGSLRVLHRAVDTHLFDDVPREMSVSDAIAKLKRVPGSDIRIVWEPGNQP